MARLAALTATAAASAAATGARKVHRRLPVRGDPRPEMCSGIDPGAVEN